MGLAGAHMTTRPGLKTTEFWLSLLVVLLGALATSGLFADDSQALKITGLAITVLGALGYTVSRGVAKRSSAPPTEES